ncbi:hypothetical protein G7K_4734-t1 [Saitoella complicata NRRL Y-17804]|uniref:RING-type domain-containing protein n=2 Tax=Saitoella complicata (strain BCRC 22490 / CBS 7301 / JCM 7358 / NBRC 10748 / NRRL Y-17804) TaxID=698492 RepID=A0A0E9NMG0_SAICN|nr:hypothetical protein G7K_4734-t1 [Saitoella complicata NRRL Y-17804]
MNRLMTVVFGKDQETFVDPQLFDRLRGAELDHEEGGERPAKRLRVSKEEGDDWIPLVRVQLEFEFNTDLGGAVGGTHDVDLTKDLSVRLSMGDEVLWISNDAANQYFAFVCSDGSISEGDAQFEHLPRFIGLFSDLQKAMRTARPRAQSNVQKQFHTSATLRFNRTEDDTWRATVVVEVSTLLMGSGLWPGFTPTLEPALAKLIDYIYPSGNEEDISAPYFYEHLPRPPVEPSPNDARLQDPRLDSTMLPYQRRAAMWMLQREGKDMQQGSDQLVDYDSKSGLHPMWVEEVDANGQKIFVNRPYGLVCKDESVLGDGHPPLKGGLLAEEMGLGKTLEIISLILLHQCCSTPNESVYDVWSDATVTSTKATLVITPPSILNQWLSECQKHAPSLKIGVYDGIKRLGGYIRPEHLLDYDVVLTTYDVLKTEIHFAAPASQRSLRPGRPKERGESPLLKLMWWRVCLDESQMVENKGTNASRMACMIPRVNAWAVSGTPMRSSASDVLGLLTFLRYYPFNQNPPAWNAFVHRPNCGPDFMSIFGIACRHTKDSVGSELELPVQRRVVLSVDLTPVEEHNYSMLFKEFLDEAGFNELGDPTSTHWDPEVAAKKMQEWLFRLRQTCCHMQLGRANVNRLGGGQLRSIKEVLEVMVEQATRLVASDELALVTAKFNKGRIHDHDKEYQEALDIWFPVVEEVRRTVKTITEELEEMRKKRATSARIVDADEEIEEEDDLEGFEAGDKMRYTASKARLRGWLEAEHRLLFFIATAYFQEEIKDEEKESKYYEEAKVVRSRMLQAPERLANRYITGLKQKAAEQDFPEIPEMLQSQLTGGFKSRHIFERLQELCEALNEQANVMDDWRNRMVELLTGPLVDQEDFQDATGEEYTNSLDVAAECSCLLAVLVRSLAWRVHSLNGFISGPQAATSREEEESEIMQQLKADAEKARLPLHLGSLQAIRNEFREIARDNMLGGGEGQGRNLEREIAAKEVTRLHKVIQDQLTACNKLENEFVHFNRVYNARVDYFAQLQVISDSVLSYEPNPDPRKEADSRKKLDGTIKKLPDTIAATQSRHRYLLHLQNSADDDSEAERICIICQDSFETGVITGCGHLFCKECLTLWRKQHATCPACKTKLSVRDTQNITYRTRRVSQASAPGWMENEEDQAFAQSIYAKVDPEMLQEIKSMKLVSDSYGSKIDMIVRHLLWIRWKQPKNSKSIIFSQWSDMLDVIQRALEHNDIKNVRLDRKPAKVTAGELVQRFNEEPDLEVFMLHARSQSAGLTLNVASNVFLCEPFVNSAIELQAISRVHRIGQTKDTWVWLYTVHGTVEEKILDLSTKRRLQNRGKSSDAALEDAEKREKQANLKKLVTAGGEVVANKDLWSCFFGGNEMKRRRTDVDERGEREVKRELRAGAAESRAAGGIAESDV